MSGFSHSILGSRALQAEFIWRITVFTYIHTHAERDIGFWVWNVYLCVFLAAAVVVLRIIFHPTAAV